MAKIQINYDELGFQATLLHDGDVEDHVKNTISRFTNNPEDPIYITYGSALPIYQWRVMVKEKVIALENINFVFRGEVLNVTSEGRIEPWPRDYLDHETDLLSRL